MTLVLALYDGRVWSEVSQIAQVHRGQVLPDSGSHGCWHVIFHKMKNSRGKVVSIYELIIEAV
jgi:hypothetical protein